MFGLAKGMGKGVVGLVMRPTGGLIDLASGSLDTVRRYCELIPLTTILIVDVHCRGTALNNVEVLQMRPPRFIDKEGVNNCNWLIHT